MGFTKNLGWVSQFVTATRDGKVGINKVSPNTNLDINGNTLITGSLNVTQGITGSLQGTATTASFTNVAGLGGFVQGGNSFGSQATLGTNDNQSLALETSGSTRMFISSSGNVGIGTATPKAKTEFASGLPTSIPTYTNKTNGIVVTDGGAIYGRLGVSNFSSTGAGYPTYLQAGDFDGALYYNLLLNPLGGNVGIGTTSPTEKLEVSGHIKFGDASYNSTLNQAGIAKITSTFTDQSNVQFYGHTGGASNNLIMTLRGGGNVGIGTSSPASMLHAKASGYPTLTLEGGTNSGAGIRFFGDVQYAEIFGEYESATNGQMFFRTRKAGTISTAMTILSSGNVGIGTTSPSFQTHISKGTSTYLCVDNTSNDYRALFGATSSGTKIYSRVLSNNASAPMGFVIGETEVMTLDTGGAVIHNGVKTQSASGYSDISTTFYVDFRAFTSTPYKIVAALTHWIGAYGAYREMVEFNNAYTDLSYIDILNHSSTAGGSWSISRPDNATLRVTHNGGNYAAYGNWWIQVIGN